MQANNKNCNSGVVLMGLPTNQMAHQHARSALAPNLPPCENIHLISLSFVLNYVFDAKYTPLSLVQLEYGGLFKMGILRFQILTLQLPTGFISLYVESYVRKFPPFHN